MPLVVLGRRIRTKKLPFGSTQGPKLTQLQIEMENSSKEELQVNVILRNVPRFKAGADLSKKVKSLEVKRKRVPRFKAGADLSSKVNLMVNVDHETTAEEEVLTLSLKLSEEALEVPDTEE